VCTSCGQTGKTQNNTKEAAIIENQINKPKNPYYSNTDTTKLNLTDSE
jgi:peptide-methionine (R)-S-oxide reductase